MISWIDDTIVNNYEEGDPLFAYCLKEAQIEVVLVDSNDTDVFVILIGQLEKLACKRILLKWSYDEMIDISHKHEGLGDEMIDITHKHERLGDEMIDITHKHEDLGDEMINITHIHESLRERKTKALSGLHSFSGCDTVGKFTGKGKRSWLQTFMSADET